ncbi:Zinc finger MYM-type protein 1 [Gonioctena quinquepunctata]|nr:Zinc finger MYM-type protein 1 [Gonioctena quinquepunctata]
MIIDHQVKMSKRTSLQASLFTYFTKAQKTNTASDSSTSARPSVSEASTSSSFSTCTEISEVSPEESNLLIHQFDLGNYVGNKLDDDSKFKLLSTPWTPGEDFKFPVSERYWRRKHEEENREKLFPIVEAIKFCGRQELALRGTNDSGPVSVTDEEPVTNDGNFRAISRMRMECGDTKLLKHSENIALNATYMSAKVQNDLISICGEIIQKGIVKCLNEAKVFPVSVDETADISGHEQLSLCVRHTKKVETCYVVEEDFLGFEKVDNTTAQPLADTIIASLKNLDIDCNNMVGQGYDGAAVMKEDSTSQLKKRFTDHKKVIAAMNTLIPTVCSEKETPFPREDLVTYEDLVELDEAQGEFQLWKLLWQGKSPSDRPPCAIEAVGECNGNCIPTFICC